MFSLGLGKIQSALDLLLFPAYRWAVRREFFRCAALIATLSTFSLNPKRSLRVLFLDRSIFRSDLEAMASVSGNIQYIGIQRKYFKEIMNLYFEGMCFSEVTYHHDEGLEEAKKRTRCAVETVLGLMNRCLGFDGIMSCNFGYPDQQEIFNVARERAWPVIVLYKEGLLPQFQLPRLFSEYQRKYLNCDLLLCYNSHLKALFESHNIPSAVQPRVRAVGIPRLDVLRKIAKQAPKRQVVFFSFLVDDKIRFSDFNSSQARDVNRIAEDFHKNIVQLAVEYSDLPVLIKTKTAPQYLEYVLDIITEVCGVDNKPPNLFVTNNGVSSELIRESSIVIGSHSTTLIEGLLAGRLIGCPKFPVWFDEEHGLLPTGLDRVVKLSTYNDLVNFTKNEAMDRSLSRCVNLESLEDLIFTTEFDASSRAEREITKLLRENRDRCI